MQKQGTASHALIDGGYLEFQLAVLRALPRELDLSIRQHWRNNGQSLARILQQVLLSQDPPPRITVDCDALPSIPEDLSLEGLGTEHRKTRVVGLENHGGRLYANGCEVICHPSMNESHGMIDGNKLCEELKGMQLLNACVLDALLGNPELIPDEWKRYETFFWGDVFRDKRGSLWVRGLYRTNDGWWNSCRQCVDGEWPPYRRAACVSNLV